MFISHKHLLWILQKALNRLLGGNRWSTRGWTLQELVAPKSAWFFSQQGKYLGSKEELLLTVGRIARTPAQALKRSDLLRSGKEHHLARMDGGKTTAPEDAASCLIGISDVEFGFLFAGGAYKKWKNRAMKTLHQAIATAEVDIDPAEHVIRVGGACWSGLAKLSLGDFQKLNAVLDGYRKWVL
jgi:hypothetical protein